MRVSRDFIAAVLGSTLLPLASACVAGDNPAPKVQPGCWETSYSIAESRARRDRLPLVVHFYADWCVPCQNMDRDVLQQSEVVTLLDASLSAVKVNSDQCPELVKRFAITALPTDLFFDAAGKEVRRTVGRVELSAYVDVLKSLSAARTVAVAARQSPRLPAKSSPPSKPPAPATQSALDETVDDEGFRIGLRGYSPVSLTKDRIWKRGAPEFAAEYLGVKYRLADAGEKRLFLADPARYIPRLHGYDTVDYLDQKTWSLGQLEYSWFYGDQLFLFRSPETRDAFSKRPARYAAVKNRRIDDPQQQTADRSSD